MFLDAGRVVHMATGQPLRCLCIQLFQANYALIFLMVSHCSLWHISHDANELGNASLPTVPTP